MRRIPVYEMRVGGVCRVHKAVCMNELLERLIISSTPTWRVLLAVFASTPYFVIVMLAFGLALQTPAIRADLNMGPMLWMEGTILVGSAINVLVAIWLWPRRQRPDAVPAATLLVVLAIGPTFTLVTVMFGAFTFGTDLVLLGVLAVGLMLFERGPMLIAYGACVLMFMVFDVGVFAGWWTYAPAIKGEVIKNGQVVWWFDFWRQFVFVAGYVMLLGLLLLLFQRLDAVNAQLSRLSFTDGLTGLANRRRFMEILRDEVTRQARSGQPMCLVLIDADHFKRVNDEHGHLVGDEVLQTLGRLLMACVRSPTDLAARLGGEEFALLLPDTRREQAEAVCARLREQLARHQFGEGDARFKVTLSMGLSADNCVRDAELLLKQADAQLYRAKASGRDRVCVAPGWTGAGAGAT